MTIQRTASKLSMAALLLSLLSLSAAAAQETRPEPPKIIRKAGGVLQGSAIKRVEAVYPPLAAAARVSGSVVVEVTVDEEGNVISARAISGHPLLKDSAVAAARGWKFHQTKLSGVPVKVIGTITFNFNLGEKPPEGYGNIIENLKKMIEMNPSSHYGYQILGMVYAENNQFEEAVEAYQQALRLLQAEEVSSKYESGNKAIYLDNLGWAFFKLDKLDEAERYFNEAVALNPNSATTQEHLGDLYKRQGKNEMARESWQKALTLTVPPDQSAKLKAKLGAEMNK